MTTFYYVRGYFAFLLVVYANASFSHLEVLQSATAYNYTAILTATTTRTSSTAAVIWTINDTEVYQVDDSPSGAIKTPLPSKYEKFLTLSISKPTAKSVYMELEIKLQLFMDSQKVRVKDFSASTNTVKLNVTECVAENNTCVTTNVSHSPCGLGCNITFTCANGCSGDTVSAFCSHDGTWNKSPQCKTVCPPVAEPVFCGCDNACLIRTSVIHDVGDNTTLMCPEQCIKNATATCSANGTFIVTQKCPPVTCDLQNFTPSLNGCKSNCSTEMMNPVLAYGELVNVTCIEQCHCVAIARCEHNGMNIVYQNCTTMFSLATENLSCLEIALIVLCFVALMIGALIDHYWSEIKGGDNTNDFCWCFDFQRKDKSFFMCSCRCPSRLSTACCCTNDSCFTCGFKSKDNVSTCICCCSSEPED